MNSVPNATETAPIAAVKPVEVRGLVNSFGTHVVHQDLDLSLERGEIMGVVGGSGSGKTVLLKSILGLHTPTSGVCEVFGEDIRNVSSRKKRDIMARWGILFQSGALFSALSVIENICVPMREFARLSQSESHALGLLKMSLVGLPLKACHLKPSELSGGMVKRVALARALALDPELLFLDEPTAGLDPIGAASFDSLILELAKNLSLSVFMITHDLDSLYAITDSVAVLADKKVIAKDKVEALETYDHPWIYAYFHGPRSRIHAHDPKPMDRS